MADVSRRAFLGSAAIAVGAVALDPVLALAEETVVPETGLWSYDMLGPVAGEANSIAPIMLGVPTRWMLDHDQRAERLKRVNG